MSRARSVSSCPTIGFCAPVMGSYALAIVNPIAKEINSPPKEIIPKTICNAIEARNPSIISESPATIKRKIVQFAGGTTSKRGIKTIVSQKISAPLMELLIIWFSKKGKNAMIPAKRKSNNKKFATLPSVK